MSALSSLLVQDQIVSVSAIEEALQRQVIFGGQLDTNLLELGAIDEALVVEYKARVAGMAPARLEEFEDVDRELILSVPRKLAERFSFVPLRRTGQTLRVAVFQSENESGLADAATSLGLSIEPVMASELRLRVAMNRFYGCELPSRFAKLAGLLARTNVPRVVPRPRPTPALPRISEPRGGRRRPTRPSSPQGKTRIRPGAVEKSDTLKLIVPRPEQFGMVPESGVDEVSSDSLPDLRIDVGRPSDAVVEEVWGDGSGCSWEDEPGQVSDASRFDTDLIGDDAIVPAPLVDGGDPDQTLTGSDEIVPAPTPSPPPLAVEPKARPVVPPPDGEFPGTELVPEEDPLAPLRFAEGLTKIETAATREEIFDAVVRVAAGLFDYTAIFVVKGAVAHGKAAAGAGTSAEDLASLSISLEKPGVLWTVAQAQSHYVGPVALNAPNENLLGAIARRRPLSVVIAPVILGDRVVVLLYGDCRAEHGRPETVSPLLFLARAMGQAFERLIVQRKHGSLFSSAPPGPPPELSGQLFSLGQRTTEVYFPGVAFSKGAGERDISGDRRGKDDPGLRQDATPDRRAERGGQMAILLTEVLKAGRSPDTDAPGRHDRGRGTGQDRDEGPKTIVEAVVAAAREGSGEPWSSDELAMRTRALARQQGLDFSGDGERGTTLEVVEAVDDEPPVLEVVAAADDEHQGSTQGTSREDGAAPDERGPSEHPAALEGDTSLLTDGSLEDDVATDTAVADAGVEDRPPRPNFDSIPTVIVDMGEEIEDLVERALGDGEEAERAAEDLLEAGEAGLPSLVRRFPGDLRLDWESLPGTVDEPGLHGRLLEVLRRYGAAVVPYVVPKLRSGHVSKRFFAVLLLGTIESDDAMEAVGQKLLDTDPRVASLAGSVLGRAVKARPLPQAVFHSIRAVLSDPQAPEIFVHRAAEAAGELRDRDAVPALIEQVRSVRGAKKVTVLNALRQITGQDFGSSARRWSAWWRKARQQHRIEWLIEALDHRNERVRATAARELSAIVPEDFGFVSSGPRRERERARVLYQEWWKRTERSRPRDD